jgi:2-succinyl-5-enolpyruvyl-6-hydroxy-3-cyclohexene-1-carboxylate synthase
MNSTTFARNMVRQLIEVGISDFVISPGSRNAPLSIALYQAELAGLVDLHVRVDERGAGFFALGLSKASQNYVVAICTSGTAAANLHPAMLEAFHSHERLLVITADRPERLRRTGSNQTTDHVGIMAPVKTIDCTQSIDIRGHLEGGPIHLNLQFDEPLLGDDRTEHVRSLTPSSISAQAISAQAISAQAISVSGKGVLIVGHDRAGFSVAQVESLAKELGWPLIAEDPLSFSHSVPHAALLLSDPIIQEFLAPEQIIIVGRATLSRSISTYLATCKNLVVIDPRTKTVDVNRKANQIFTSIPAVNSQPDAQWVARWKKVSASVAHLPFEWSEQAAISAITRAIPNESALFVGSSRPVRDIEAFAQPRTGIDTFANRGLAGIDGNIASTFGIATHYERSYAIIGDLTFLHDISALINPVDAKLMIFVIDNNGGGIFDTLPQAGVEGFEKIFGTPHGLNLEHVISGFGYPVDKAKSVADLERLVIHPFVGLHFVIVEVPDRKENAARLKEITQSLCSAVRIGNNLA